jgi:hypothetical protein
LARSISSALRLIQVRYQTSARDAHLEISCAEQKILQSDFIPSLRTMDIDQVPSSFSLRHIREHDGATDADILEAYHQAQQGKQARE